MKISKSKLEKILAEETARALKEVRFTGGQINIDPLSDEEQDATEPAYYELFHFLMDSELPGNKPSEKLQYALRWIAKFEQTGVEQAAHRDRLDSDSMYRFAHGVKEGVEAGTLEEWESERAALARYARQAKRGQAGYSQAPGSDRPTSTSRKGKEPEPEEEEDPYAGMTQVQKDWAKSSMAKDFKHEGIEVVDGETIVTGPDGDASPEARGLARQDDLQGTMLKAAMEISQGKSQQAYETLLRALAAAGIETDTLEL